MVVISSMTKAGFFLTSAAEKTKTQGQNSSKKLKEKTQPLGATLLKFVKTQEKNSSFSQISRGTPKYTIFIAKYFQKREHFGNCFNLKKNLNEKTQNSRKIIQALGDARPEVWVGRGHVGQV